MLHLIAGGLLVGALVARHFVGNTVLALVLATMISLWGGVARWNYLSHVRRSDQRLASAVMAGFGAFAVAFFVVALAGVPALVMVAALGAAASAIRLRRPVDGPLLPTTGEPFDRVVFEGHAHGEEGNVPGGNLPAVAWVARQGQRRWSSTRRFELRAGDRTVQIDPSRLELSTAPWVHKEERLLEDTAQDLEGANPDTPIRVWFVSDKTHCIVAGTARLERDSSASALRDGEMIAVFADHVTLTKGYRSLELGRAKQRLAMACVVGACATTAAIAMASGHW